MTKDPVDSVWTARLLHCKVLLDMYMFLHVHVHAHVLRSYDLLRPLHLARRFGHRASCGRWHLTQDQVHLYLPQRVHEIVPLSSVEFRAPLVRPPRFRAVDAQKKPKEFYVLNDDIYENY